MASTAAEIDFAPMAASRRRTRSGAGAGPMPRTSRAPNRRQSRGTWITIEASCSVASPLVAGSAYRAAGSRMDWPDIAAISRARPRWPMASGRLGVISASRITSSPAVETDSTGMPA